jgi:hypothetical protein
MNARIIWKRPFFIVILLSLLISGCGPETVVQSAGVIPTLEETPTTAPTNTPLPTDTPVSTVTPTATSTATPRPTPTATPNLKATVQAEATAYVDAVLKRIEPDITAYGYTLADGHLLWINEEAMEITVEEYGMSLFNKLDAPVTGNFILQTNITWNTTGGLAGCGLFFRMDEAADGPGNQFEMWRLQNAPAWNISYYDRGQWQRSLSNWVYTNSIIDENDSTNKVALVVDGRNIYPYINGKKQRLVEDITLKEGLFAISATQDSGVSTCIFEDTWIWAIDKK